MEPALLRIILKWYNLVYAVEGKGFCLSGKRKWLNGGLVMVAMIVSRVLGYVRDLVIYATFGQNRITDAYNAAFSVPDFLYMLLVEVP